MVYKTKSASKVLKLMDRDYSYSESVRKVMKEDKISRYKLERQLEPFI